LARHIVPNIDAWKHVGFSIHRRSDAKMPTLSISFIFFCARKIKKKFGCGNFSGDFFSRFFVFFKFNVCFPLLFFSHPSFSVALEGGFLKEKRREMKPKTNDGVETPEDVNRLYRYLLTHEYTEQIKSGDTIYIGVLDRKRDASMCRDKAVVYVRNVYTNDSKWRFVAMLNTDAEHWSDTSAREIVYEIIKLQFPTQKPLYLSYRKKKNGL
jgi:hypothetical protein